MAASKIEIGVGTHSYYWGITPVTKFNAILKVDGFLFRSDDKFETEAEAEEFISKIQAKFAPKPRKKKASEVKND